jgi:hypothetical protein
VIVPTINLQVSQSLLTSFSVSAAQRLAYPITKKQKTVIPSKARDQERWHESQRYRVDLGLSGHLLFSLFSWVPHPRFVGVGRNLTNATQKIKRSVILSEAKDLSPRVLPPNAATSPIPTKPRHSPPRSRGGGTLTDAILAACAA